MFRKILWLSHYKLKTVLFLCPYFYWVDNFIVAIPSSGRSSRASTGGGSRPPSRAESECSEISEPEMYTTVQHETKSSGGRNQTVVTYQTHVVKTRTASNPSPSVKGGPSGKGGPSPSARGSRIPKPSTTPKKWWINVMWFT